MVLLVNLFHLHAFQISSLNQISYMYHSFIQSWFSNFALDICCGDSSKLMESICITRHDCDCKNDYGGFACIGMYTQKLMKHDIKTILLKTLMILFHISLNNTVVRPRYTQNNYMTRAIDNKSSYLIQFLSFSRLMHQIMQRNAVLNYQYILTNYI